MLKSTFSLIEYNPLISVFKIFWVFDQTVIQATIPVWTCYVGVSFHLWCCLYFPIPLLPFSYWPNPFFCLIWINALSPKRFYNLRLQNGTMDWNSLRFKPLILSAAFLDSLFRLDFSGFPTHHQYIQELT